MDVVVREVVGPDRRLGAPGVHEQLAQIRMPDVGLFDADSRPEYGPIAARLRTGETVTTANGVTIVAPENLPASMPLSASQFYARNISSLLLNMVKDGELHLDFEEEVTKATVITHAGAVVSEPVQKLLAPAGGTE